MNGSEKAFLMLIGLTVLLLVIGWLATIIPNLGEWMQEYRYINSEIRRTSGRELEYYKKKRRRLLLALLPFFRY